MAKHAHTTTLPVRAARHRWPPPETVRGAPVPVLPPPTYEPPPPRPTKGR